MKHVFKVGDEVLAKVHGFEPFPAVVESVLLNEAEYSVFYYVRFRGASKPVPLDAENLQPSTENKHKYKLKYSDKDLKKESKMRVDALLGADDEIPEVLMNFVTVDSDFEEVSEETVKKLGLFSITLTPRMVEKLDERMSPKNGQDTQDSMDDDYIDVEDIEQDDKSSDYLGQNYESLLFCCPTCKNRFSSKKSLKVHISRSLLCNKVDKQTIHSEQIKRKKKKSTRLVESGDNSEDLSKVDRSKWASRSASGYYPCKLCFRKFRSKGEAQLHMSSHKSQKSKPNYKQLELSDDSNSVDDDDERNQKHCSMERVRRAELAAKFAELADVAGVENGASKVRTLEVAKTKIEELERESEQQDQKISYLQEKNFRLRARYLELDPKENSG